MKAAVLAGGKGLRLRPLTEKIPKPLIKIGGMTLIERTLIALQEGGITEAVILIGYKGDTIRKHLLERSIELKINFIHTNPHKEKLYAFSALKTVFMRDRFLLISSDLVFDSTILRSFIKNDKNSDLTIAISKYKPCINPVQVLTNETLGIIDIGYDLKVNTHFVVGMYICSPSIFKEIETAKRIGIERFSEFLKFLIKRGYDVGGYEVPQVYDVNTLTELAHAKNYLFLIEK